MRIYEELFIMKPDVPEEEITAFIEQISAQITTAGGTVDKVENWGKRRLAYKVEKQKEGHYVLIQFSSEATTVVKELERRLRVADSVIKFLTVRIDETLKRIEKRKKERDKRAHRRATNPRPETTVQPVTPLFAEPEAHAAPGLPPVAPVAAPSSPAAPISETPVALAEEGK
jgi:small subunit ribosomal protein S6